MIVYGDKRSLQNHVLRLFAVGILFKINAVTFLFFFLWIWYKNDKTIICFLKNRQFHDFKDKKQIEKEISTILIYFKKKKRAVLRTPHVIR
jgi:hypothetical protein